MWSHVPLSRLRSTRPSTHASDDLLGDDAVRIGDPALSIVGDTATEAPNADRTVDQRSVTSTATIIVLVAIALCLITAIRIVTAPPELQGSAVRAAVADDRSATGTDAASDAVGFEMSEIGERVAAVDQIELDDVLEDVDSMLAVHTASQLDYDACREDFGRLGDDPAAVASRMFAC